MRDKKNRGRVVFCRQFQSLIMSLATIYKAGVARPAVVEFVLPGDFAGTGSGTPALFFGCGFINSVSAAPAMSRMPAVMKEDW